jgi:hypothetical protein
MSAEDIEEKVRSKAKGLGECIEKGQYLLSREESLTIAIKTIMGELYFDRSWEKIFMLNEAVEKSFEED